jgi:hypothetical protein
MKKGSQEKVKTRKKKRRKNASGKEITSRKVIHCMQYSCTHTHTQQNIAGQKRAVSVSAKNIIKLITVVKDTCFPCSI